MFVCSKIIQELMRIKAAAFADNAQPTPLASHSLESKQKKTLSIPKSLVNNNTK